jgi:D-alanyl-D-alanine-carboxypeptidase/D-alanyl-D-alanine-endopeptidase
VELQADGGFTGGTSERAGVEGHPKGPTGLAGRNRFGVHLEPTSKYFAGPMLVPLLTFALLAQAPAGGTSTPQLEARFADVDALVAAALSKEGGGVLRVAKPGQVLVDRAYGPYRLDDAVPIAAGTQLLSVVVLLHLVDMQTLSLDARVGTVLKDWPEDKAAITLRMLLAHTAGLSPSSACLDDRNISLEACVHEIASLPLKREPGTAVIYGGTGLQVAARMAEVASGKRWAELFREHLTAPLGLRETGFGRTANPRVAGGAQSTAGEYGKVLDVLLEGGQGHGVRLLNAASVEAIFQDQSGGAPLVNSPYSLFTGREATRPGFGVWLDRTDGHGRGLEAVCQGAYGFTAWVDRERRLDGVLLLRSDLRRVVPLEQEIRSRFRKALPVLPAQ